MRRSLKFAYQNKVPEREHGSMIFATTVCVGGGAVFYHLTRGETGIAFLYGAIAAAILVYNSYADKKDDELNDERNEDRYEIYNRLHKIKPYWDEEALMRRTQELMFNEKGDYVGWWYAENNLPEEDEE